MAKDVFSLEELENILDLKQEYLRGMCEGSQYGVEEYHSGYAVCLKDIARALGLDPDNYGTPRDEEEDNEHEE